LYGETLFEKIGKCYLNFMNKRATVDRYEPKL